MPLVSAIALLVGCLSGMYSLLIRESLISDIKKLRSVTPSEFPVNAPSNLEKAHAELNKNSTLRTRYRYATLLAVLGVTVAAGGDLVRVISKHF
jgi:hypothetical protein